MEKDDRQLLSNTTTRLAIAEDGLCWKPYNPLPEKERDGSMAATVTRRANAAGVGALSRRLMARERARILGRKPADVPSCALELEARRWIEERVSGK